MSARTATQAMAEILVVVAFVVGLAWLLDDLMPPDARDWTAEPIEDDEQTEGDMPSCEIQQPEPWPRK